MNIRLVVAIGNNREIGEGNRLLWSLPDDLKYFRTTTLEKPVVMGRKTYESIGKPLPNRTNIILTKNDEYFVAGAVVTHSLERAIALARKENVAEICIIGGAQIYSLALPMATHLSVTHVNANFPHADAFFPEVNWSEWNEISRTHHEKDEQHSYSFDVVEYERK